MPAVILKRKLWKTCMDRIGSVPHTGAIRIHRRAAVIKRITVPILIIVSYAEFANWGRPQWNNRVYSIWMVGDYPIDAARQL